MASRPCLRTMSFMTRRRNRTSRPRRRFRRSRPRRISLPQAGHETRKLGRPDARALQLEVTDRASIAAAAERIRKELGRLDALVNNAAISNTSKVPGMSVGEHAKLTRPSNVSLDEVRAVWGTNVFGVLAVYQAMLPLLREASAARIVNVSSGVGSLTTNADPASPGARPSAPSTLRPRRLSTL
jgi:NAD(P)-dependent dehydrogenase (short-subunit alcohol dehydrogenase family)